MTLSACAPPPTVPPEPGNAAPAVSWRAYKAASQAAMQQTQPNPGQPPVAEPAVGLESGSASVAEPAQAGKAQDAASRYDLPALVDLALSGHPETRASWEEAKAAAARLERQRSAWYPTLTAMTLGQYAKTSIPIPGGALVSHGFGTYSGLELAWTLLDFGRRSAAVEAGAQRLQAANFAFSRTHQDIAYRVATGFFAYQAALSRIEAARQTFETAKVGMDAVQARLGRGLATRPELLLAIQEQAKAHYDLQDAKGAAAQAQADLTASLGVSPLHAPQLVDLSKSPLPAGLENSVEKIIDQALAQRPDLAGRLAELRAREAEVKKARAEFWPKLALKGTVGNQYWGDIHTTQPTVSPYTASNLVGAAMLNVEWNLFDGFERRNAVREAEARRQASQAELEAQQLIVMRDIWKAYADTKTALEKREFAQALLQAAEASYAATHESFTHGFSTVMELLSAQKDLARAQYTEIDSRANLLRAAATLAYTAGAQPDDISNSAPDGAWSGLP